MHENIGSMIRYMRKTAGMSQSKLAEKLGVTYQQVQKYEKAKNKISVPKLIAISEALDVPVSDFLQYGAGAGMKVAEERVPYNAGGTNEEETLLSLFRGIEGSTAKKRCIGLLDKMVRLDK